MKYIWSLCLLLLVVSCNKDPEYFTLEAPDDQMFLKASSTDVTLEEAKENEVAVTFSWNKAADRGADTNITYFFKMWMTELSSNVTELYEIPEGEQTISFTHKQLNNILANWKMTSGDKVTIEAEVVAKVNSSVQYFKPEISKTKLNVVGYGRNITAIYLVMLSDNGDKTTRKMTEIVGTGVYQSTLDLVPCKYYFTFSPDDDSPAYMKGESDNTLKYVSEVGDGEMLKNSLTGTSYTMVVDVNELDVNIVQLYNLPKGGIWIVGASCPDIGWNIDNAMSRGGLVAKDPRHPEIWTYTGEFVASNGNENQFKLSLEGTFDANKKFFFAPFNGANPIEEHRIVPRTQNEGGDYKWSVPVGGTYTLSVNIDMANMSIDLVPVK